MKMWASFFRKIVVLTISLIGFVAAPEFANAQDAQVLSVQEFLITEGFSTGRADGFMGPRTRRALIAFQNEHGIEPVGEIDQQTIDFIAEARLQAAKYDSSLDGLILVVAPPPLESFLDEGAEAPRHIFWGSDSDFVQNPPLLVAPTQADQPILIGVSLLPSNEMQEIATPYRSPMNLKTAFWIAAFGGGLFWLHKRRRKIKSPVETLAGSAIDGVGILALAGNVDKSVSEPSKKPLHVLPKDTDASTQPPPRPISIAMANAGNIATVTKTATAGLQVNTPSKSAPPVAQAKRPVLQLMPAARVVPPAAPKPAKPKPPKAGWVSKGQTVNVAGRQIGGMVYIGTAPKAGLYGQRCKAYINPALAVASFGNDYDGQRMSYWPSYSEIDAVARATYLDWLAGGCKNTRHNVGYVFLYFYGLERRFFVDNPSDQDRIDILEEVRRLQVLFAENYSARNYLSAFVELAQVVVHKGRQWKPVFEKSGYELPLRVKTSIAERLVAGKGLDADWALSWLLCDPETRLRTPAERCKPEFMALFRRLFTAKYPEGMKMRMPKRVLAPSYDAASGEFSVALQLAEMVNGNKTQLPDISGSRKPLNDARAIAEMAMEQLDKFSRFLGRNPEGRGTIEAHALLPASLWPEFPCGEVDALKDWVGGIISNGGLVPLIDVIERLEKDRPQKIAKRRITGAADALARLGVGMAPDPRYALRSPKYEEPVVLFPLPQGIVQLEDASDAYRINLANLALATIIAQADGVVVAEEMAALMHSVASAEGVSLSERARLQANLKWFLAVPQDISLLRARLRAATAAQIHAFKQASLAMVHADRVVRPEEVAKIERVYKALGLDGREIYADLHGFTGKDAPVTMRPETPGASGVLIPPEAEEPAGIALDPDRIKAIMADTGRVATVLGDIFSEEEPQEVMEDETQPPHALAGLSAKYQALVAELISRPHWPVEDFQRLVVRYKLMASGCLEVINEWAFETFEDALIEEYDGFEMNGEIVSALQADTD